MSEVWLVLAVGCALLRDRAGRGLHRPVDGGEAPCRPAARVADRDRSGRSAPGQPPRAGAVGELRHARARPVRRAGRRASHTVTPIDTRDRIAKKLVLAGSPAGWDAERVLAFKIIGAATGSSSRDRGVPGHRLQPTAAGRHHRAADVRGVHRARHDPQPQGRGAAEGHPQDPLRHPRPPHDQRRGGTVAQRGDRPGRAERSRRALVGVRPHAPGDPARRAAVRGVPPSRRADRRRGAERLRPRDDPGRRLRGLDRRASCGPRPSSSGSSGGSAPRRRRSRRR